MKRYILMLCMILLPCSLIALNAPNNENEPIEVAGPLTPEGVASLKKTIRRVMLQPAILNKRLEKLRQTVPKLAHRLQSMQLLQQKLLRLRMGELFFERAEGSLFLMAG